MRSRSTRVGLGLAIAGVLAIVWALLRFGATSDEHTRSGAEARSEPVHEVAVPESRSEAPSTSAFADEATGEVEVLSEIAKESAPPVGSVQAHGITLYGYVTDARGGPVRLDELLLEAESSRDPSRHRIVELWGPSGTGPSVPFDSEGRYSFTGLSPGGCTLEVRVPGYRPWYDQFELPASDHDWRVDIALEPYELLRLRIVIELDNPSLLPQSLQEITHDCEPTRTVHVVVTRDPPPERLARSSGFERERDLIGKSSVRDERGEPGTWVIRQSIELRADLPLYAAAAIGDQVLESKRIDSTEQEVLFVLSLARVRSSLGGLRFRVVDEQGQPSALRGTCDLVRNTGTENGHDMGSAYYSPETESGPSPMRTSNPGEVRIVGLHPGAMGIRIQEPGYAHIDVDAVVEPGVERDLGEFRLERPLTIRGHVLHPDGTPAEGVDVECAPVRDPTKGPSNWLPMARTTDTPGGFAIYDIGRGSYLLRAYSGGDHGQASRPLVVSTEGGPVDGIVMQLLETTQVTLQLEEPPKSAVTIRIEDVEGLLVMEHLAETTKKGAFSVFKLIRGRYTARALAKGREIAASDIVAGADPLRVVLTPR
ncbi:MAG TPA: carboxypeptidase-like regulatory domain-containing protein [Planctomycetota bacterium]|jgi:hypothetical protein|nr:carboxypeptidase-like regulatory domain-containing protein [Planctomycetota bacterium]